VCAEAEDAKQNQKGARLMGERAMRVSRVKWTRRSRHLSRRLTYISRQLENPDDLVEHLYGVE